MNRIIVCLLLSTFNMLHAGSPAVDERIKIDQFGYTPDAAKFALVSDPVVGYNAPAPFAPSAQYEVRRWDDDSIALQGAVVPWNGGAIHAQSGDRVWRFNFTSLTETGEFYVYDPVQAVGSHRFEIRTEIYLAPLQQALRTFFYQRCGAAKAIPFAEAAWTDASCHLNAEQDLDSRLVTDVSAGTSRDLAGGWHDAGDYNKYVNFADGAVHDLLAAYEDRPEIWGDALGIPESGNGVPDILDEIRWELDWLLKMQDSDGSLLHKVSVTDFSASSPPSTDSAPRRYAEPTASATISGAGVFAHAAIVFRSLTDSTSQAYASQLETAALSAWQWLEAHPSAVPSSYDGAGFANAPAEDPPYDQQANRTCAASYLYVLTEDPAFRAYVDTNHGSIHLLQWFFAYTFESEYQDCLLYYSRAPQATSVTVTDIEAAYAFSLGGADNLQHHYDDDDAYRAHLSDGDYVWGSNRVKSQQGLMYENMRLYGLDPANAEDYRVAAAGYVHYLHGSNPTGLAYLTNMAAHGAERSVQELYHGWFAHGTVWDSATSSLYGPAPGFVPGGPNPSYSPDASYGGPPIEPPANQPIQKSYLDWNTAWPENSWEVTENHIPYQSAYIKLLSKFTSVPVPPRIDGEPEAVERCAGSAAAFAVEALGVQPLFYQWRKDGIELGPDVGAYQGTRTNQLSVNPVGAGENGVYDVVVSGFSGGIATSNTALLTVVNPPSSPGDGLRLNRDAQDVILSWGAVTGADSFDVLRCDATSGACIPSQFATSVATSYTDTDPSAGMLWYRLQARNSCAATP